MSTNSTLIPPSDSDIDLHSVAFQKSVIASNLSSTLVMTFLMGIYTMVYFRTLHLYYMKNFSRESQSGPGPQAENGPKGRVSKVPIITITALYIFSVTMFGMNWYYLSWVVVDQGDTRASMFEGSLGEAPEWFIILFSLLQYSLFSVADGLLIWRCFHVWNRSFYVIGMLLPLLLAEIGIGIATTVYAVLIPVLTTPAQAALADNIQAAAPFLSCGTTIITTFLIGYRIHSTTRLGVAITSLHRFQHIVMILVESAAAYSIMLLFWAILGVIPAAWNITTASPLYCATFYVESILLISGGLAPTIIVARIAMSKNSNVVTRRSTVAKMSGLQFNNDNATDSQEEKQSAGNNLYTTSSDVESGETVPARKKVEA